MRLVYYYWCSYVLFVIDILLWLNIAFYIDPSLICMFCLILIVVVRICVCCHWYVLYVVIDMFVCDRFLICVVRVECFYFCIGVRSFEFIILSCCFLVYVFFVLDYVSVEFHFLIVYEFLLSFHFIYVLVCLRNYASGERISNFPTFRKQTILFTPCALTLTRTIFTTPRRNCNLWSAVVANVYSPQSRYPWMIAPTAITNTEW